MTRAALFPGRALRPHANAVQSWLQQVAGEVRSPARLGSSSFTCSMSCVASDPRLDAAERGSLETRSALERTSSTLVDPVNLASQGRHLWESFSNASRELSGHSQTTLEEPHRICHACTRQGYLRSGSRVYGSAYRTKQGTFTASDRSCIRQGEHASQCHDSCPAAPYPNCLLYFQKRALGVLAQQHGEAAEEDVASQRGEKGSAGAVNPKPYDSGTVVEGIRNVAIIAHVDHGKTTLMDRLLRACGAAVEGDRVMDSISLERERGITIASKYTSMEYKGVTLNIVDTPGHADFGGEVERVMGMVDGALLLVDAAEGPLAQTKFVLQKALKRGLRPVVVLNKMDRPSVTQRMVQEVESSIFDLFASFDADEHQLDFPVLYASAREGWATASWPVSSGSEKDLKAEGMMPLLDAIVSSTPAPQGDLKAPFTMLVSMIERDNFLGRILTGRVSSGSVRVGERVRALRRSGREERGSTQSGGSVEMEVVEEGKVIKLLKRIGTSVSELSSAAAGDIVGIAGLSSAFVSHTIAHPSVLHPIEGARVDPPTIVMTFGVNNSPLAGRHGSQMTGPKIGDRLFLEAESNVSISVEGTGAAGDEFKVMGRGELQLGVLIENMRREGFELSVSPPSVMFKTDERGSRMEPIEEVLVEVDDAFAGVVIEHLSLRKGEMEDMQPNVADSGRTRLLFSCPSRGLLGVRSVMNTATHGTAIMHRSFKEYAPYRGSLDRVRRGVIVSMASGTITGHALMSLESRGTLFVEPGMETYDGHIIGENSREEDLEVNPVRTKQLTNVRSAGKDENVQLTPPRQISLEDAIGYVASDELIEVTPASIRLRKKCLNSSQRKVQRRNK